MSYTGSWVWDVHSGTPVYWSAGMCRIHGRDVAEGPPSIDEYRALHQPEDWAGWLTAVQNSVRDKTEIDFDCGIVLPEGIVRHIRMTGHPVVGAAEEVTEIVGSASEFLEPREGFPQVQKSIDPVRQAIDLIPALAWSCRPDGSADFFNRGWLEYTGLSEHQAVDWGWTMAFHPEDVSRVVSYWQTLLARSELGEIEARLRRSDGEYRWFLFRAQPLMDESGRIMKWYGTNTDIEDRKRAEEALRESERQLRQLVETIPALIWRGNSQGELEYLNQRHVDYIGQAAGELSDGRWLDLVHPEHRDATVQRWLQSVRTGSPYEDVYRLRRSDGQYRWIQSVGVPFRDSEGRIAHWYGMVIDIDDRKSAEDAFRESERELRLLVETIPALIWRATPQGRLDYVNQRVLDYTGSILEALQDSGWDPLLHPDDVGFAIRTWRDNCEAGSSHEVTFRLRRADGQYRWFQVHGEPLRGSDGHIVNWYGLMLDIDDRKRAEQALRERETDLRGVLETMPALVLRSTPAGQLEYVNQRAVEYLAEPLEQIGFQVVHPDDRDNHVRKFLHSLETGEHWENTYRLRRTDGEYRWFHVGVEPLRGQDGRVASWLAVNIDIDDRKQMEETLRNTRRRLSTAMQIATVAELSASIAHEINQPLAAVVANGRACISWLSGDPPNLERARLTLERIIRDGNAASEVVGRIRALFKQAPPAMLLCDINEIIVEVLKLIVDETRDSGTSIETDLAVGLPMIVVDRVQIQQALINLAHNAIEAMEGVTDRPRTLSLTSLRDGVDILIQIRDSGCGIANPASIFDPFFTTKEKGMGMGLAICRSIVEVHGGRLWATANEDAGTTFSLTLPLHPDVSV